MAILRKGEPTIKTRLFTALSTGEVKVDALSDPGQMRELAKQFECAPVTVKRYLQEWRAQQAAEKKKHIGYENPEREIIAAMILAHYEDGDWETLESQEVRDLLNLMFDFGADVALAGLRKNEVFLLQEEKR